MTNMIKEKNYKIVNKELKEKVVELKISIRKFAIKSIKK